jgi:hypothetical protein
MPVLTQGYLTGEYLVSEAPGMRSRDAVTVTVTGGVALPSGTVLGKITATSKFVKYSDAASDGSQTAAAILYEGCPGTNGDYKRTVHNIDCEVIGAVLNGGAGVDANGKADLLALGIKVR